MLDSFLIGDGHTGHVPGAEAPELIFKILTTHPQGYDISFCSTFSGALFAFTAGCGMVGVGDRRVGVLLRTGCRGVTIPGIL